MFPSCSRVCWSISCRVCELAEEAEGGEIVPHVSQKNILPYFGSETKLSSKQRVNSHLSLKSQSFQNFPSVEGAAAGGHGDGGGGVRVAGHKQEVVHNFRLYGLFYTSFWLYGLRKYGHFRIYGQLFHGPEVDHISGSECISETLDSYVFIRVPNWSMEVGQFCTAITKKGQSWWVVELIPLP